MGAKDRDTKRVSATVVQSTDAPTLHGFVERVTDPAANVYTDDAKVFLGMDRNHEGVNRPVEECVREFVHINGMESFWSMLNHGRQGTY